MTTPREPCPGPIRLGDQYILYCDGCGHRDVDDEWEEKDHFHTPYECFKNKRGRCVWKIHAGKPCTQVGLTTPPDASQR